MDDSDKCRAHARACIDMAKKALRQEEKAGWLRSARIWLALIPEPQLTRADHFEAVIRERGTGQMPSTSMH